MSLSPLIFRSWMSVFCWRTYQQLNIKCRNKATCPGRIARICFLLKSTPAWRHSQHLESCAISTGAFELCRSHGSVLLEETVYFCCWSFPSQHFPPLLCCVWKSPMDSAENSPSTLECDTQWSIFHLATVLSPDPLKFLMGSFKTTPSPLASETFTCIYSVLLSHAARIKNTQRFSTKQKKIVKKPQKTPHPNPQKTKPWLCWAVKLQETAAFLIIQLWPAFQRLLWGLAQVVPHFQHYKCSFWVVPSTDGAAAVHGERIHHPCMWVSINKSPAFLGRTILTEQFPGVGKAGTGNRGYKQGRARKKPTNPAYGKW